MPELNELCSVAEFARRYPNIIPSESALRWYLRERDHNGLLASGAVVELRQRSDQIRPKILIRGPRFAWWLINHNGAKSAESNEVA